MPSKKKKAAKKKATPGKTSEMHPIAPKLYRRFFEPVALLCAIDPVRGERQPWSPFKEAIEDMNIKDLLHAFLCHISYICDRKRGGDTVTAAALGADGADPESAHKRVLVFASNTRMQQRTLSVLESILEHMRSVKENFTEDENRVVENAILSEIVELANPRLRDYSRQVRNRLNDSALTPQFINSISQDEGQDFQKLLEDIHKAIEEEQMLDTVQKCYEIGHSNIMTELPDNLLKKNRENPAGIVTDLRHLVGRLGRHVSAAKTIIRTAHVHRSIFSDDIGIYQVDPSKAEPGPLKADKCTPDSIIGRMYSGENEIARQRETLKNFNNKWKLNIPERLAERCNFTTRVHAEMQLVNAFTQSGEWIFYDSRDKFIGCSKAACYLCAHYVQAIAKDIELRGSHQNLYLCWRPPDIPSDAANCQVRDRARSKAMNDMVKVLRKDVENHLKTRTEPPRSKNPDSSTGITQVGRGRGRSNSGGRRGGEIDHHSMVNKAINDFANIDLADTAGSSSAPPRRVPRPVIDETSNSLQPVVESADEDEDDNDDDDDEDDDDEDDDDDDDSNDSATNTTAPGSSQYEAYHPYSDTPLEFPPVALRYGYGEDTSVAGASYAPSDFSRDERFAHSDGELNFDDDDGDDDDDDDDGLGGGVKLQL